MSRTPQAAQSTPDVGTTITGTRLDIIHQNVEVELEDLACNPAMVQNQDIFFISVGAIGVWDDQMSNCTWIL